MDFLQIAQSLYDQGFSPIPIAGKRPTLSGWQQRIDDNRVRPNGEFSEDSRVTGVGVVLGSHHQGRLLIVIDADIYDEALSFRFWRYLEKKLAGKIPTRVGKHPKFCVPVLFEGDLLKKQRSGLFGKHQVEVLASGQQFAAYGIHPDTGEEYTWNHGHIQLDQLAVINGGGVSEILEAFSAMAKDAGFAVKTDMPEPHFPATIPREGNNGDKFAAVTSWADILEPHGWTHFISRNGNDYWTRPGKTEGISASTNALYFYSFSSSIEKLEPERAYSKFRVWTFLNYDGDFSEATRQFLDRHPEFKAVKNTEIPGPSGGNNLVDDYIFIDTENAYFRLEDKQMLPPSAFNALHKMEYPGNRESPSATTAFHMTPEKRSASGIGWLPIDGDLIEIDGVRLVNRFLPPSIEPKAGPISQWLLLCEYIYGEYLDLVLDHMAFSLQQPLRKIRWQVLCCGAPRTGKSLTIRPLLKIWGASGVALDMDETKDGWGDGLVGKKFVVMEEIYMPGERSFYNRLKIQLANDDTMRLNVKGKGKVTQPNLFSMVLFTNHMNALHFDVNDDKLLVIEAPSERWLEEDYREISDAIDDTDLVNHIYHFLLNRDVSKFCYGRLPVRTAAAEKMSDYGRPDYQNEVIDLLQSKTPPFDRPMVHMEDIKDALEDKKFRKYGNQGISEALHHCGWDNFRGQRKVAGRVLKTRMFWSGTRELEDMSASEIYDWYNRNLSTPFSR